MRVMTFNLRTDFILDINNRWKDRSHIACELITKYECDIIGVQEFTSSMYEDISRELSNYRIVGKPRAKKISSERNDILVSEKHEILESNTFWLSESPEEVGSSIWYSIYPRICTTAVIRLSNNKVLRVYNTHLDCFFPKARQYGLNKIEHYIGRQYEEDGLPVILMGDFNATPNSKLIKKFSESTASNKKFIAVQESERNIYNMSTMSKFKGSKKGRHIDYIFVSEDFDIINTKIVDYNNLGKYPSDHYPILADLKVR
ncbi:MAG TPA: endonuclease [Clostridium sp.]|nr:endonuclease [Clostridium sp.]